MRSIQRTASWRAGLLLACAVVKRVRVKSGGDYQRRVAVKHDLSLDGVGQDKVAVAMARDLQGLLQAP